MEGFAFSRSVAFPFTFSFCFSSKFIFISASDLIDKQLLHSSILYGSFTAAALNQSILPHQSWLKAEIEGTTERNSHHISSIVLDSEVSVELQGFVSRTKLQEIPHTLKCQPWTNTSKQQVDRGGVGAQPEWNEATAATQQDTLGCALLGESSPTWEIPESA